MFQKFRSQLCTTLQKKSKPVASSNMKMIDSVSIFLILHLHLHSVFLSHEFEKMGKETLKVSFRMRKITIFSNSVVEGGGLYL